MLQPPAGATGRHSRAHLVRRLQPALLVLLALLALAGQVQADEDVEDVTPREVASSIAFSSLQHVASTGALAAFSPTPTLRVAPNGQIMVSFNHVVGPGRQNPYYSLFNSATRSWGAPQPIRNSSNHLRYVTFGFDSNSLAHAVWLEGSDVFYAARTGWPTATKNISNKAQNVVDPPAMAIGPDNVIHVVWTQGTNLLTVYHTYSRNGGATWSAPTALTGVGEDATTVGVTVTADNAVHAVWERATAGAPYIYEIYYRKGTPAGTSYTWGSPAKVSLNLTTAKRPALLAEGNNLHLSFTSQISGSEQYAYYRRFASGAWGPLVNVNSSQPVSVNTSNPYDLITGMGLCGGNVHVFFHGAPFGEVNERIWAGSSSNNWQTLTALTPLGQRYIYPTIGCYNGNIALGVDRVAAGTVHDIFSGIEEKRVLLPLIRRN
jgi:hypothetical protein